MTEEEITYKIKKPIFIIIIIINIIYLAIIINEEGPDIIKPYKNLSCPQEAKMQCEIILTDEIRKINTELQNYEEYILTLQPGENIVSSNVNLTAAKKFNRRVLYSLIIGLIINHIYYNRKYPTKKKLKEIINKNE